MFVFVVIHQCCSFAAILAVPIFVFPVAMEEIKAELEVCEDYIRKMRLKRQLSYAKRRAVLNVFMAHSSDSLRKEIRLFAPEAFRKLTGIAGIVRSKLAQHLLKEEFKEEIPELILNGATMYFMNQLNQVKGRERRARTKAAKMIIKQEDIPINYQGSPSQLAPVDIVNPAPVAGPSSSSSILKNALVVANPNNTTQIGGGAVNFHVHNINIDTQYTGPLPGQGQVRFYHMNLNVANRMTLDDFPHQFAMTDLANVFAQPGGIVNFRIHNLNIARQITGIAAPQLSTVNQGSAGPYDLGNVVAEPGDSVTFDIHNLMVHTFCIYNPPRAEYQLQQQPQHVVCQRGLSGSRHFQIHNLKVGKFNVYTGGLPGVSLMILGKTQNQGIDQENFQVHNMIIPDFNVFA